MSIDSKPELTDILADLISFKTNSTDFDELNACFDYLEHFLKARRLHLYRHKIMQRPALVAATRQTKKPKILLQAHIDVVPAKERFYRLSTKQGRYYGRGVYDMKFAAACYLKLVDDLREDLRQLDFGVMFSCDEEIGGASVGRLLKLGYGTRVCFLPDGGDNWQIEKTSNALWMIKISAKGEAAHGSRPWEGVNAITALTACLSEVGLLFGDCKPNKSSLTISQIHGGRAINQVPDHAEATLDMRFIDSAAYHKHRQAIERIVGSNKMLIETIKLVEGTNINLDQPEIASFIKIANRFHSTPIKPTHSLGATDARYFDAVGIPTIIIRPTGGGAHSEHEWIDQKALVKFYEVLKAYVIEVARRGSKAITLDTKAPLVAP